MHISSDGSIDLIKEPRTPHVKLKLYPQEVKMPNLTVSIA